MPRRARIILPNIPLHPIQRSNRQQAGFFADADYRADVQGESSPRIRQHALYLALRRDAQVSRTAYRKLLLDELDPG